MKFNTTKEKIPIIVKYCLYARKSMETEERQALSIDSQISEMKRIAERDNLQVVYFKSEAHSAKDSGQRIIFNELIQDIKDKKYNGILTWNTDRLSRNAGDLGQIVDLIDKGLLIEIRTFSQNFTNTPNDKFLLMILGSQAKLENDNRAINVQRGMRARVQAGLWPSVAPTGYLNSKFRDHLCEKDIDPVMAPIVKQMFEKVGYEGYTNRQLYSWLKDIGIRSRNGKAINMGSIYDILHRTFYYGDFEYPKKSGKWYHGKHEPIIDKKLFDLVQKTLKTHSSIRSYNRTGKEPFTFSKFMKCGLCDSGIIAQEKFKRQKNGNTHRYVYYYCGSSKDRTCKSCYISEENLIKLFIEIIDVVDIDLIGMRDEIDKGINKSYGFKSYLNKEPIPERTQERKDFDVRKFAQIIFEEGTNEEKLGILKNLKGKIILNKDKSIHFDKSKL
jgi:DNA invertase Pin-like site-specific DNA recombinase